jgi:hypothetical protein
MTRRLVKRIAAPPHRYGPPPPRVIGASPAARRRDGRVRAARIAVFSQHLEMSMLGFEPPDLYAVKAALPSMRWDKSDKVWLLNRRDLEWLIEVLEANDFFVRLRHADE